MFLKTRELTHMEGAQLGQGFDSQPGKGRGKFTDAGNSFPPHFGDGVKQQKIRQSGIYYHHPPLHSIPSRPGRGKLNLLLRCALHLHNQRTILAAETEIFQQDRPRRGCLALGDEVYPCLAGGSQIPDLRKIAVLH